MGCELSEKSGQGGPSYSVVWSMASLIDILPTEQTRHTGGDISIARNLSGDLLFV